MDMKNKRLLDKIASAFITASTTVLMFGLAVLWLSSEPEVEDDGNTVTIEYDCREVMAQPQDFPDQVVSECVHKQRFFKKPTKTTI